MSVRAIEAEVSIKSGIEAECSIGREVIVEVHEEAVLEPLTATANGNYEPPEGVDGYDRVTVSVPPTIPDIESLMVTANGVYTASGDGYNPVTVNVEIPKDPNVIEGEFEGTDTGVLTIDTGYEGDSYPKAIIIYDSDGIIKDDAPLAYTISAFMGIKVNGNTPNYSGNTQNNQWRHQTFHTGGSSTYVSTSSSVVYICTQTTPSIGAINSVKMPDNKTLKIYVTDSTSTTDTRFRVGIRYKYKVFY